MGCFDKQIALLSYNAFVLTAVLLQELARYEIDVRNIVINQLIFPEAGKGMIGFDKTYSGKRPIGFRQCWHGMATCIVMYLEVDSFLGLNLLGNHVTMQSNAAVCLLL